jgi:phage terminase large subunit GpA-like protein
MPQIDLDQKASQFLSRLRGVRRTAFAPPSRMPCDEWADTYRRVPAGAGSLPGPWSTSAVEVARGPMRAITERGVTKISGVASAQIFKTSTCETAIGRFMHLEPCPMLIFEPTEDTAEGLDAEKLEPMIRATPELAGLFGGRDALSKQNQNFVQFKKVFPGGYLRVFTAGSVSNLGMRSVRVVMFDELDKIEPTRDGDALKLGEERLKRYKPNDLSIAMSTPTVTGRSRIIRRYEQSDQRKPYVTCPACGDQHVMEWENVQIPKGTNGKRDASGAYYASPCCGYVWTEADRLKAITTEGSISWRQTRVFECCGETQDPDKERLWVFEDRQAHPSSKTFPVGYAVCKICGEETVDSRHAGFWAWEIYNPKTPVTDTAREWLDCQGNRDEIRNFVNSKLARTFAEELDVAKTVSPDHLAARSEPPWPGVPSAVRYLTAGVDVQEDRLEIEVVGWADADESWSLDYQVIVGNPREDDVWLHLDEIIRTPFDGEDGRAHYIQATCVDAGFLPDVVAAFSAPRHRSHRVWAIKSMNETGPRAPIWPSRAASSARGAPIYRIGSQAAKDRVYSALGQTQPGPAFMHVPSNRDARWYDQLTAEHLVRVSLGGGREGTRWQPKVKGRRNEALDCRVYALAALQGLRSLGVVKLVEQPGAAISKREQPEQPRKRKPSRSSTTGGFGAPGW